MKFIEEVEKTGFIPTYRIQEDLELLAKLPDSKPSKRIIKTKKGIESMALLKFIENNKNHSWYQEVYERNKDNLDANAIFYRGRHFTYGELFERVDSLAKGMLSAGVKVGEEIPCCLSNVPELLMVMLAASKIGARLNFFGANYNKDYIDSILTDSSNKLIFMTDDNYEELREVLSNHSFNNEVMISLADSLPEDPSKCEEYVPELDRYYHYENKAKKYKEENPHIELFGDFVKKHEKDDIDYTHDGKLDDIFTVTYTSGSTRKGFPKAMYHSNRSYIVGGIFNTSKLTNTPTIKNVRSLAHIHSDSNTDLVTSISDTLMKGAEVAMEPEYSAESALDVMYINNPVLYTGTRSHLISASKQFLIDKRFNNEECHRKLGRQLVTIAVGEPKSPGEEKFINTFLRKAKAGSDVEVILNNGIKIKLPFGPMSFGGGDTEHGGLFYTLQLLLKRIKYAFKGKKFDYGMDTVPFATVTALKLNENGEYEECDYNERGIIVANSITNMAGYKNNTEKTKSKIIRDNLGRDWLSCDVLGYVNELGNPIFLGRLEDVVRLDDGSPYYLYQIDEIVCRDSKNVLSCSAVSHEDQDLIVLNIELSPLRKKSDDKIIASIKKRCEQLLPMEVFKRTYFRIIDNKTSYPLSGSGKRSITDLKTMSLDDIIKVDNVLTKGMSKKKVMDIGA